MTFPTWDNISKNLGMPNVVDPNQVFGNKPFVFGQPFCGINNKNYAQSMVGIDIPVLLEPANKNGHVIVILGESPLRNNKAKINGNNVIFGTPYAVHQQFNSPSQCDVYKLVFDGLLSKGYTLYLTDIIKEWWKGKKMNPTQKDINLLKDEINLIMNKCSSKITIVTWGAKAKYAIKKANLSNIPVISILHPGKNNWNNWKLRIFKKAIYNGDIKYATSKYPNQNSSTTDKIVSEEALSEILQNLKNCSVQNVKKMSIKANY